METTKPLRNLIITILATTVLISCSNTFTSQLWNKEDKTDDVIESFVMSKNEEKMIFVSKNYHYVLDTSKSLVEILSWSNNKALRVYLSKSFNLGSNNKISGSFVIGAKEPEVTPSRLTQMKNIGFTKNKHTGEYTLRINLSGERFLSKGADFENLGQLNEKYRIQIVRDGSLDNNLAKTILSPFTLTADVLIMSSVTILAPVFYAEEYGKKNNKKSSEHLNQPQ